MDIIQRVPTVGIVIINGEKVLLVKHEEGAGHLTGSIGTPGGRIDAGETALQAAVRELEEETGIHVKEKETDLKKLPHIYDGDLPRKDGSILHTHHTVFAGDVFTGQLKSSDETTPVWMNIVDVLEIDASGFLVNTQDMIRRAIILLGK